MNLDVRAYTPDRHFELIKSWFDKRKFPAPDPDLLPPTGCVIYMGEIPMCAGFLFKTDTPVAVIAHLIADPDTGKSDRSNAVDYLLITLQWAARDLGFKHVMCSSNLPQVCARFEKVGFLKGDENVTTYRRDLCHSGD